LRRSAAGRSIAVLAAAIAMATAMAGLAAAAPESGEQRGISKTVSRAPLPGGLVLTVEPGSFAVERGGLRAPLSIPDRSAMPRALKGVDIDPDHGQVIATITDSSDKDHAVTLSIADLNARLDDLAAQAAAAAQLKAGKSADAIQTLAPLLAKSPVATYAHVATDPALAPLLRRPELVRLRERPPGTAKLALGKNDVTMTGKGWMPGAIAVSARHHLIATVDGRRSDGACAGDADLVLADSEGSVVARVPLYAAAEMTTDTAHGCPFARPARPRIAARVAAATRLLADLGFSPAPPP
jgi:hypothetical protein